MESRSPGGPRSARTGCYGQGGSDWSIGGAIDFGFNAFYVPFFRSAVGRKRPGRTLRPRGRGCKTLATEKGERRDHGKLYACLNMDTKKCCDGAFPGYSRGADAPTPGPVCRSIFDVSVGFREVSWWHFTAEQVTGESSIIQVEIWHNVRIDLLAQRANFTQRVFNVPRIQNVLLNSP